MLRMKRWFDISSLGAWFPHSWTSDRRFRNISWRAMIWGYQSGTKHTEAKRDARMHRVWMHQGLNRRLWDAARGYSSLSRGNYLATFIDEAVWVHSSGKQWYLEWRSTFYLRLSLCRNVGSSREEHERFSASVSSNNAFFSSDILVSCSSRNCKRGRESFDSIEGHFDPRRMYFRRIFVAWSKPSPTLKVSVAISLFVEGTVYRTFLGSALELCDEELVVIAVMVSISLRYFVRDCGPSRWKMRLCIRWKVFY